MNLLPWVKHQDFMSWKEYEEKINFLDQFYFEQHVRKQNLNIHS